MDQGSIGPRSGCLFGPWRGGVGWSDKVLGLLYTKGPFGIKCTQGSKV